MEKTGICFEVIEIDKSPKSVFYGHVHVEVPNGSWLVEGDIRVALDADRILQGADVTKRSLVEHQFVISRSLSVSGIKRYAKDVICGSSKTGDWTMSCRCLWFSNEPFVVSMLGVIRDSSVYRHWREPEMIEYSHDIYWPRQVHKGELGQFIPVGELPRIVCGSSPDEDKKRWVSLLLLADAAKINPVNLAIDFLALRVFSTPDQPAFVHAPTMEALETGPIKALPRVNGYCAATMRENPNQMYDTSEEVPLEEIWVAWPAACDIMRLAALGVTQITDLFPSRHI